MCLSVFQRGSGLFCDGPRLHSVAIHMLKDIPQCPISPLKFVAQCSELFAQTSDIFGLFRHCAIVHFRPNHPRGQTRIAILISASEILRSGNGLKYVANAHAALSVKIPAAIHHHIFHTPFALGSFRLITHLILAVVSKLATHPAKRLCPSSGLLRSQSHGQFR